MKDAAWVFGVAACCFAVLGTAPGFVMAVAFGLIAVDCWRSG